MMALMLVPVAGVPAQTTASRSTVSPADDMRLWSFGDCERRFPVNSDDHKACVRVVGSAEAKDARALKVCEVSHAMDREEIDRCKAAYRANKEKAVREGVVANAPAAPQTPPSEEMMRRVKAITTAAIEEQQEATGAVPSNRTSTEPAPATQSAPANEAIPETPTLDIERETSSVSTIGLGLLAVVFLGYAFTLVRKRQASSA
jgi:hypothetical protein